MAIGERGTETEREARLWLVKQLCMIDEGEIVITTDVYRHFVSNLLLFQFSLLSPSLLSLSQLKCCCCTWCHHNKMVIVVAFPF